MHEGRLDRRVLLVVDGDFRPHAADLVCRHNGGGVASGAARVVQSCRGHCPHAMSFLFSGGSSAAGQVIGSTDRRGEHPLERSVGGGQLLATLYRHAAIDTDRAVVGDPAGRPGPLQQQQAGTSIRELTAVSAAGQRWRLARD